MVEMVFCGLKGILPTSEYSAIVDGKKIGFIQLRHKLSAGNGIPFEMASHVYYEVFPEERNKGYAKYMLRYVCNEAKKLGLAEIFITCENDNIQSKKVIEANGGELVKSVFLNNSSNEEFLKYKINL